MLIPFFSHKYTINDEWRERIESIPDLSHSQKQNIYDEVEELMNEASDKSSGYAIVFCAITWIATISAFFVKDTTFSIFAFITAFMALAINTGVQGRISGKMHKQLKSQIDASIHDMIFQNNKSKWENVVPAHQQKQSISDSPKQPKRRFSTEKYNTFAMSVYNISTSFGNAVEQELERSGDSVLSRQTTRLVDKATLTLCLYSFLLAEEKLNDSDADSIQECRECLLEAFASRLMESKSVFREQLATAKTAANAKQTLLDGEITADIASKYLEQIDDIVEVL